MNEPVRVLVVEDDPDISESIEVTLRLHRYEVTLLHKGDGVVDHVQRNPPDIIIMDVMIPPPDGYELCRRLKSDTSTKSIPLILLSARTQAHERDMGFRMGADRYLTKPFMNDDLLKTMDALLSEEP
jgi:DNA-binding response OmpR family regulator